MEGFCLRFVHEIVGIKADPFFWKEALYIIFFLTAHLADTDFKIPRIGVTTSHAWNKYTKAAR